MLQHIVATINTLLLLCTASYTRSLSIFPVSMTFPFVQVQPSFVTTNGEVGWHYGWMARRGTMAPCLQSTHLLHTPISKSNLDQFFCIWPVNNTTFPSDWMNRPLSTQHLCRFIPPQKLKQEKKQFIITLCRRLRLLCFDCRVANSGSKFIVWHQPIRRNKLWNHTASTWP